MTILEVIQRSSDFLAKRAVESPRLQAELLLAHALGMPRLQLYLNFNRVLTDSELEVVRGLVKRRGQREPLQHIVGSTSFCGMEIGVNPGVLIPRPETEVLAELAWKALNDLAESTAASVAALDFGTGTGCLAILLALKSPSAKIHALDVSLTALKQAQSNADNHKVRERITFVESNGFSGLPVGTRFDFIVANPPYIPTGEIAGLEAEVRDYDPVLALDGGPDGLDFFRRLAAEAGPFLNRHGKLFAEFGDGQEASIPKLLAEYGWSVERIVLDLFQRPRIIVAQPCQA